MQENILAQKKLSLLLRHLKNQLFPKRNTREMMKRNLHSQLLAQSTKERIKLLLLLNGRECQKLNQKKRRKHWFKRKIKEMMKKKIRHHSQ